MKKIIFMIAIILSSFSTAFAFINSQNCAVGNCPVTVSDCGSGLIDFYSSATCTGNPLYEFSFNNGATVWYPTSAGTYYAYALCDDGRTHSICSLVNVGGTSTQTTTANQVLSETTSSAVTTTTGGGSNTVFYVLIIVIIAVVAFIAYRLLSKKKKPKINYESLYRKWGR